MSTILAGDCASQQAISTERIALIRIFYKWFTYSIDRQVL
jgi:hypothetical protein